MDATAAALNCPSNSGIVERHQTLFEKTYPSEINRETEQRDVGMETQKTYTPTSSNNGVRPPHVPISKTPIRMVLC